MRTKIFGLFYEYPTWNAHNTNASTDTKMHCILIIIQIFVKSQKSIERILFMNVFELIRCKPTLNSDRISYRILILHVP